MKEERTRPYRQSARARATARTRRRLVEAAVALWREQDLDQVTLDQVARRAGTTRQTLLRHFGSKEGLFEALLSERSPVEEDRDRAPVGDVAGALAVLLDHYERDGVAVQRTLALEGRSAMATAIAARGRAAHREWCGRVFAPFLPSPEAADRDLRLDAFVAATDFSLYKLLRLDLGRSLAQVHDVMQLLVGALADDHPGRSRP